MNDRAESAVEDARADTDGERALRRYRALVNTVDGGVYQLDAEGRFVAVNGVIAEMTGYAQAELLGAHVSLLLDDGAIQRVEQEISQQLAAGQDSVGPLELSVKTADGERLPIELRASLLLDDGTFRGTVGVARDLSERNRSQGRIGTELDSGESIATVLDEADVGVFLLDDTFEVAWIDETAGRYFGIDREETIGRDKRDLIEETIRNRVSDGEAFADTVLSTYEDNSYVERFECRITPGEGREGRWLEHRSKPIETGEYAGGRVELYYDITDRKQSRGALRESEEEFASLVDAVEEYAIFRLDPDGHVISWNNGARDIKGYEAEEILGKHFSTFYTEQDRAAGVPERNLERATENGSIEDEGWRVRNDGSRFWAAVTITAIRDDGTHRGYLKVTRDMTDRYQREQELENELQRIYGRISDAFYAVDDEYRFTHVNERAEQILDADREELIGTNLWEAFPEIEGTTFETRYREAMATQESLSFEEYYPPSEGWFEVHVYPSETGLSIYFRDVSERIEREQELERRARQQQAVADLGQFALETDDLDELMREATRRVANVLDNEYCNVLDLDAESEELLLRQGVGWREGTVGEATVSSVETDSQAAYTLANDHPTVVEDLETETHVTAPELLTSHGVRSGISATIGPVDEPWGVLGTYDTDRREFAEEDINFVQSVANILAEAIERNRYEEELEQVIDDLKESNERLEQFAYAASHDLQEPLRMVSSYLRLIKQRYDDELDEDGEELLEFAVDGADRMREMIDGLLKYSRVETRGDPFEPVDLEAVVADVRENLRLQIEDSGAEISVESVPVVEGDASQLRQLFQNLLDNAITYSGDEPPRIHVRAERRSNEWAISVEDEGIGIDPDDQDSIFEVFQRLHTQDEHEGTGIGLALCKRIVERHGGKIWVESDPGEGTTISFTLPAVDGRDRNQI